MRLLARLVARSRLRCRAGIRLSAGFDSVRHVLTRLAGTTDIRAVGSGNIGATNVLRTGHKGLAAATLLGDALKGTVAVLIAALYGRDLALLPRSARFSATSFRCGSNSRAARASRPISASCWRSPGRSGWRSAWSGSLSRPSPAIPRCPVSSPVPRVPLRCGCSASRAALLFALLTVLLWIKHRSNIVRLVNGSEGKIGAT